MRYCTRCGRLQSGNDRFCTECGTPFGPQPDQRPAQPPDAGPAAQQDPYAGWAAPGYGGAGQGYGGAGQGDAGAGQGYSGAGQGYGAAGQPGFPPSGQPGSPGPAGDPLDSLFRPYPPRPQAAGTADGRTIAAPPEYGPGGIEFGPPQPQRPGSASRRILLAAGVLVLLAAGGTGAWLGLRHSPSATGPASAASPARPHATAPPASAGPASTPPVTPTASATQGTGSSLVAVSPGVARTGTEPQVVALLNNYFRAINTHDYQQYSALLGPRVRRIETAPVFRSGYRTTTDSAVTLTRLSAAGAGQVAAGVTFISHQAAADSPSHSRCTYWNILLVLGKQHGRLLLQPPPAGYHASFRAC